MIDLHCHLLPGIDDGPPTLEAALALARDLVLDGMSHVVCTPHVFPGRFENRSSSIEEDFARFIGAIESAGIPLALSWAGEVRLTPEVLDLSDARCNDTITGRESNRDWKFPHLDELWAGADALKRMRAG